MPPVNEFVTPENRIESNLVKVEVSDIISFSASIPSTSRPNHPSSVQKRSSMTQSSTEDTPMRHLRQSSKHYQASTDLLPIPVSQLSDSPQSEANCTYSETHPNSFRFKRTFREFIKANNHMHNIYIPQRNQIVHQVKPSKYERFTRYEITPNGF